MNLTVANELNNKIKTLNENIETLETKLLQQKKDHANAEKKPDKDRLKKLVNVTQAEINIYQQSLAIAKTQLQDIEIEVAKSEQENEKEVKQEIDEQSIIAAMKDINANFIINTNAWHCIYSSGNRFQPATVEIDHEKMINHVYRISNNYVDKFKLLKIARQADRIYRDVERTFQPKKESTLNQMNELRKFWLKPIFGYEPHIAFEVLTDNIAGQRQEYKDQLEKYIAYSYVKPEDIFTPNIDSSGKGGTGRDTLFRMLEIIFTEECCGEAKKETVQGTHNGELKGKIWVKISEQNNRTMNIEELKNLTGGHNFRLREMGKDPKQVPRTFRFFMMSNNYEGTAKLTGGGSGTEDRRWEPMLCSSTLLDQIQKITPNNDRDLALQTLDDWQQNVYYNDVEVAKWLGCIIERHGMRTYYERGGSLDKLVALHGEFYQQMINRQKRVFDNFMEAVFGLSTNSTSYNLDKMYRIYKIIALGDKVPDKSYFSKSMAQWLNHKTQDEWEIRMADYYNGNNVRSRSTVIKVIDDHAPIFDIWDFIEPDGVDEKGNPLVDKPHAENLKDEFF